MSHRRVYPWGIGAYALNESNQRRAFAPDEIPNNMFLLLIKKGHRRQTPKLVSL